MKRNWKALWLTILIMIAMIALFTAAAFYPLLRCFLMIVMIVIGFSLIGWVIYNTLKNKF